MQSDYRKSEICWSQWAGDGSVYICWFEDMDTLEFVLLVLYEALFFSRVVLWILIFYQLFRTKMVTQLI